MVYVIWGNLSWGHLEIFQLILSVILSSCSVTYFSATIHLLSPLSHSWLQATLLEETAAPEENPQRRLQNKQTPHRETPVGPSCCEVIEFVDSFNLWIRLWTKSVGCSLGKRRLTRRNKPFCYIGQTAACRSLKTAEWKTHLHSHRFMAQSTKPQPTFIWPHI